MVSEVAWINGYTAPFQTLAPFCFSKADKQYCMALGLSEKSDECQASTFLYRLGAT